MVNPTKKPNNVYEGLANGQVTVNGVNLDPRLNLENHSPTGFGWGYLGSGPSQLALAILSEEYGEVWCTENGRYHLFKEDIVSRLEQGKPFTLNSRKVDAWRSRYEGL